MNFSKLVAKTSLSSLIIISTISLSSVFLMAGCHSSASDTKSSTTSTGAVKQRITIAQFGHVFLYMPLYIAVRNKYFEDEGLEVKLVSTGGDEKTFTAVSTGNAQFGVADPVFTAVARERGQGGKVVASVVRGVPFWVLTFNEKIKPFDSPTGFSGYKIGAYTAPSTSYAVMKKLLQNDGKPVNGTIVQGAFGSLIPMLKANQADMAMDIEPMVSIAVKNGARVVYSPARVLGDFAFTGLTVSDEYHDKNPQTIKKVVRALAKAMDFIHSDQTAAVKVACEEFPEVPPDVVNEGIKRLVEQGTIPASPQLSEKAWEAAIALRREIGDLKGEGSFADNVDPKFAAEVTRIARSKESSTESSSADGGTIVDTRADTESDGNAGDATKASATSDTTAPVQPDDATASGVVDGDRPEGSPQETKKTGEQPK